MYTGRWKTKLSVGLTVLLGLGLMLIWYALIGGGAPPAAARRGHPLAPIIRTPRPRRTP